MNLSPSQWAALLPLIIPSVGACLIAIMALDKDQATAKWIRGAMYGTALLAVAASFWLLTELWKSGSQPSFGQLHLDRLAQFTGIFVLVAAALTIMQSWDHFHQEGWVKGETLCLLLFATVGMMLFASTSNFVLLFLALELFSIPLYALVGTVRARSESSEGGMKYFLTGAVASSCFLMGGVLIYGLSGTLDLSMAAPILKTQGLALDPLVLVGAALMLLGFLFKVSAVPFHQWTPDAYEASPHPIAGFMSVATKGVAFIALMRIFPVSFAPLGAVGAKMQSVVAVLAVATLVVGNLTALVQTNVKRMLAYSSISHAGYLMLGFVAGTPAAFNGVLFYLVIYMAMNMGAFGLLTAFGLVGEKTTFDDLRGLGWKRPAMGVAAAIFMLSLAGIPPMGGFYGKYMIFRELVGTGHVGMAILGVLASLVSAYYYLRLLVALFLQAPSAEAERLASDRPAVHAPFAGATVLVCAAIVMAGGFIQTFLSDGFTRRALVEGLGLIR
ncbi:NADH-quinone oxidoreductase subunit N [Geothrix limicola]|uniref:NADH-quinone oxidoreductase subunit N n=1 Tax=Geothrix limicola TaxID=2927978 RepID=A0ABQ5QJR7_9BACT|nr:NADH-quinone oxidoreductase subunit N [Geothrix limicola]GLH74933.1 NADH-quinone oxidoreductase subunit N [Geothrix limicola]